ncbi:MAG TPA: NUDIX domain-containing protein [Candidatus Micrarchaeota archaeon]|nr:NUDIX domain-containing protein [Candidatus Micrarchaeota archaeon]
MSEHKAEQEHSCGFVLFRQLGEKRYYLLMHYKAGHWDFAKGHVEEGESEEQTARRELEEETTIRRVSVLPGFRYEYVYEFGGKNGRATRSKRVTFMLARTDEQEVRISHEHRGARWVPYSAAMRMVTFENAKRMQQAAEEFLRANPQLVSGKFKAE